MISVFHFQTRVDVLNGWLLFRCHFFAFQARLKEAVSLEKHVLLKKLRDALEALRGRVAGTNKDDVEEAIAMVGYSPSSQ